MAPPAVHTECYIGAYASDTLANAYLAGCGYAVADGLMYRDSTLGVMKIWDGQQSAWVAIGSARAFLTPEGGLATLLENRTGVASVKGSIVMASSTNDNAFALEGADAIDPIGVVYEAGIANGSLCYVVVSGRVQVLLEDGTASTRANWARASAAVAGRATMTGASPPDQPTHFKEIGHCLETVGAGANVLAYVALHFN
jgi:hypothetical protein